jgi:hypothetical protein
MVAGVPGLDGAGEEPADLAGSEVDQLAVMVMPRRCPAKLSRGAGAPLSGGDREERHGEHGQGDVPVPGVGRRTLVVVQAGLVLGGLEAFLDRPPRAGHPHKFSDGDAGRGAAGEEREFAAGARAAYQ